MHLRRTLPALLGCLLTATAAGQAVPKPFTFSPFPNLLPGLVDGTARWADVDRDGDLDLLTVGTEPGSSTVLADRPRTRLFRNNGVVPSETAPGGATFAFAEQTTGLPDLTFGEAAFGDVDRDGDLDLLLMGSRTLAPPYTPLTRLYRNNGAGGFADAGVSFPALHSGAARWADLDRDGDLDLVLCGTPDAEGPYTPQTFVYLQAANGTFAALADAGLPGLAFGHFRLADLTGDGVPDFIGEGLMPAGLLLAAYRNDGTGHFTLLRQTPGGAHADVEVADIDADGTLDVLDGGARPGPFVFSGTVRRLTASGASFTVRQTMTREGLGTRLAAGDFTGDGRPDLAVMTAALRPDRATVGVYDLVADTLALRARLLGDFNGALAWGDADGDGDLDLVASNTVGNKAQLVLYRNDRFDRSQPPPVAAATPILSRAETGFRLDWAAPSPAVTYDVRIGTTPGGHDVRAADADADGRRLTGAPGPLTSPVLALSGLPAGTYYVGLQTIGADFVGSAFAEFPVTVSTATGVEVLTAATLGFTVASPTRTDAHLRYVAPGGVPARLSVYDALGRLVHTVEMPASDLPTAHDLDVANLPPGLYILRLTQHADVRVRTLLVVR